MNGEYIDLFAKPQRTKAPRTVEEVEASAWCAGLLETARTMPRSFYFSELRIKHGREPRVPAWWGMATHALKKLGMKPTDRVRNAPRGYGDRHGGQDRLWDKGALCR